MHYYDVDYRHNYLTGKGYDNTREITKEETKISTHMGKNGHCKANFLEEIDGAVKFYEGLIKE